ncbi:hypothetical protein [Pseudobacteriovorax antillogorgiicola]|uniref:Twin-arginine translocation pathway signal protein n=1 Tax=Pseudobacteriovorax antillogorgiicola TaxID=1513793 RepID=A0A1Y6CAR4_9BACT|nr:hypothetical protein [Pseudobacteriovorax antillogorgiicola]TCS49063.1 hypothetical protein EDD56_116106 [Pseudobacteriovorax antillogorgiicola]SMF52322.1 hypothetical protein SAMN06296036_11648 [Pseudobacteriovorax antillogorgiicola]
MATSISRRKLFAFTALGSASLGLAILWGRIRPAKPLELDGFLTQEQKALILALSPTILGIERNKVLPLGDELLTRIELFIQSFSPTVAQDILNVLDVMNFPATAWLFGLYQSWGAATESELHQFIHEMSQSRIALVQIVLRSFVSLLSSSYYSIPSTWLEISYPGMISFEGLYE